MITIVAILSTVAALWDIGRRVTNTRGTYASQDAVAALAHQLEEVKKTAASHRSLTDTESARITALGKQLEAQSTILAKHAAALTKEALEKTQPLTRMKKY